MKFALSLMLLVFVFLVNPLWGCGSVEEEEEVEYQFSERDMEEYGTGTWEGEVLDDSGETTEFEIMLERDLAETQEQELNQDGIRTRQQPACGETRREFLASAEACGTMITSEMSFRGELSTEDGEYDREAVEGTLHVYDTELDNGTFILSTDDEFELAAACDGDGQCDDETSSAYIGEPNVVQMEKQDE